LPGVRAVDVRHEPDALVPAKGVRGQPGEGGYLADRVLVLAVRPPVALRGRGAGVGPGVRGLRHRHASTLDPWSALQASGAGEKWADVSGRSGYRAGMSCVRRATPEDAEEVLRLRQVMIDSM